MINRKAFFAAARERLFGGTLNQKQVDGMNAILDEWDKRKLTDLRWLAYMLATTKWETAHTMQPIEEYGKGRGRAYGVPDPVTGQTYFGRGLVQLTWKRNYGIMENLLDVPLVKNPSLALEMPVAIQILFEGMLRAESSVGDFTGMALEECFGATTDDWIKARRIINGTDHAADIAAIGKKFYAALAAAA